MPDATPRSLGRIVRLQVQQDKIKTEDTPYERYTPEENLRMMPKIRLEEGGVVGLPEDGSEIIDVHHRDHPHSRFRGDNGVSIGFIGHYDKMRNRFGDHLTDGIAGESIITDYDGIIVLDDLANGVIIRTFNGDIHLDNWGIVMPCSPFSRFCLRYTQEDKTDKTVADTVKWLSDGTRGFSTVWSGDGAPIISVGDEVLLP